MLASKGQFLLEKGRDMGKKAAEALDINYEELADYLHKNHSVYMKDRKSVV